MRPSFAKIAGEEDASERGDASVSKSNTDIPAQAKLSSLDDYGDHSSSYWPPGWNFARWRRSTQAEIFALPEDELTKTQAGLREVLGEDGVDQLAELIFAESLQKEQAKQQDDNVMPSQGVAELRPNWLTIYDRRCKGRAWGFVVIKAFKSDGDDGTWTKFKLKLEEISRLPFALEKFHNVDEASSHWTLDWLEEDYEKQPDLDIKELQTKFASHISAQSENFLSSKLFLVATQGVVSQVLKQAMPDTEAKRWRAGAPYILALPGEGSAKAFRVASETLADELWVALEGLESSVSDISASVQPVSLVAGEGPAVDDIDDLEDIWWSTAPSPSRLRKRRRIA